MGCKHGKSGPRKRKLESGTMKYVCGKCKVNKIEDAYPRAQLKTMDEERKPTCLSCCKAFDHLKCSQCEKVKPVEVFENVMLTLPSQMIACKECQAEIKKNPTRQRAGWFTCRGCGMLLPRIAAAPDLQKRERCLNCASRNTRQKDEQTCRNKACKRKFEEKQVQGQARKRYCPACRKTK